MRISFTSLEDRKVVKTRNGIFKFSSVNNKFNCLCISVTLGLEVKKAPWTAKVLCSNLTGPVFSQTGNIPRQTKLSPYYWSARFFRLSCHIVELFFKFYIVSA